LSFWTCSGCGHGWGTLVPDHPCGVTVSLNGGAECGHECIASWQLEQLDKPVLAAGMPVNDTTLEWKTGIVWTDAATTIDGLSDVKANPAKYDHWGNPAPPVVVDECDTEKCVHVYRNSPVYDEATRKAYKISNHPLDLYAREFYGLYALSIKYPGHEKFVKKQFDKIANDFYTATVLALLGEGRYDWHYALRGIERYRQKALGDKYVEYHNPLLDMPLIQMYSVSAGSREAVAAQVKEYKIDMHDLKVVRTLRNIFLWAGRFARGYEGGYGGLMWASVAQIILDYKAGRLTQREFIDHIFNARHNGAPVLTKTMHYAGTTETWLSYRSEASLDWLIRWTPNWIREEFGLPKVKPLALDTWQMRYGTETEMMVVPDDEDGTVSETPGARRYDKWKFAAPRKERVNMPRILLSRIRDDRQFLVIHDDARCLHSENADITIAHDCIKLCAKVGCYCYARLIEEEFTDTPRGGTDGEDAESEMWCEVCEAGDHDTSDCGLAFYCNSCEEYKHESERRFCEVDGEYYCEYCIGRWHEHEDTACVDCEKQFGSNGVYCEDCGDDRCSTCADKHKVEHEEEVPVG
jgi:hypothetical protein